jgi:hypothetical protein
LKIRWPEYRDFLLDRVVAGLNSNEIADQFVATYGVPVTRDQVSGAITRMGLRVQAPAAPELTPEQRFDLEVAAERRRAADRALAREMAGAVKAQARWQEFLDVVSSGLEAAPARLAPAAIDFPVGSGTPEIFTVLIGDVHIGKLVDPAAVGETFGYDVPIFEQRWARLTDRILRLFSLHSATAPFSAFRIHFLGDGVDGVDMRRGHGNRVDLHSASSQAWLLARKFEDLIRRLDSLRIPIEVIWDFGNHGRVGEFGVNLPADNWDFVAGTYLQLMVRDLENVKVSVKTQKYHITELGPLRVMSQHGDGIRGGDGFSGLPINGMARALAKDVGLHQQLFDLYLMAHFHTLQDIRTQAGRIVMNGSWDGGDDYSINQLKAASEPVQLAFGVHPVKGITWQQPIYLTTSKRPVTPAEVLL